MTSTPNRQLAFNPTRERRLLQDKNFRLFGSSTAANVLQHFLGTPDVVTNVRIFNYLLYIVLK
jgi:hypothetical protein